jgi:hypothetical protein
MAALTMKPTTILLPKILSPELHGVRGSCPLLRVLALLGTFLTALVICSNVPMSKACWMPLQLPPPQEESMPALWGECGLLLAGLPGIDLTPPTALQRINQAIVSAVATAGAPDGVVIAMDWDVRETIGPGAGASPHVWWQAGTGALTGFAT